MKWSVLSLHSYVNILSVYFNVRFLHARCAVFNNLKYKMVVNRGKRACCKLQDKGCLDNLDCLTPLAIDHSWFDEDGTNDKHIKQQKIDAKKRKKKIKRWVGQIYLLLITICLLVINASTTLTTSPAILKQNDWGLNSYKLL
jgi:hypothetical protein